MTTYQQLRKYFTEQELDDAAVIARHSQHHFPNSTYAEIFIEILVQMRLHSTASWSVQAGGQVQTLSQLLPTAEMGTAQQE